MVIGANQGNGAVADSVAGASSAGMFAPAKRSLLLRDSLLLLVLFSVTVALFLMTLFLFKSFESHREDLGRRWSERGRAALRAGHPDKAAEALRIALSYNPDNRTDQLVLAQALAESGHTEAATNYFLSLWDAQPGDGFVNLQLARLARKRGDAREAINYYRASIFGNWEGDGVARRREGRLELAEYLAQRGEVPAARAELLIAADNIPAKQESLQIGVADRLAAIGDLQDALHYYQETAAADPHNEEALAKGGRTAYALGEYGEAFRLLSAATEEARRTRGSGTQQAQLAALAQDARMAPELSLSRDLAAGERAEHIVTAAAIAQRRLKSCPVVPAAGDGGAGTSSASKAAVIQALKERWSSEGRSLTRSSLERNPALEDSITQLIDDTEAQTAKACGAPTVEDALLVALAARERGGAQ